MTELSPLERMEQLQKRHQALQQESAQLRAKQEMAQARLAELRETALAEYGVDTLDQLRSLKVQWEAENARNLQEFEEALQAAEARAAAARAAVAGDQHA